MEKREIVRQAKRLRVELIMLGMALAREGDRDRILKEVDPDSLQSLEIAATLRGIANGDKDGVLRSLKRWGITVDTTVLEAVIKKLEPARS